VDSMLFGSAVMSLMRGVTLRDPAPLSRVDGDEAEDGVRKASRQQGRSALFHTAGFQNADQGENLNADCHIQGATIVLSRRRIRWCAKNRRG
jgi:hypothetical protein